jgi:hypothetical protein
MSLTIACAAIFVAFCFGFLACAMFAAGTREDLILQRDLAEEALRRFTAADPQGTTE